MTNTRREESTRLLDMYGIHRNDIRLDTGNMSWLVQHNAEMAPVLQKLKVEENKKTEELNTIRKLTDKRDALKASLMAEITKDEVDMTRVKEIKEEIETIDMCLPAPTAPAPTVTNPLSVPQKRSETNLDKVVKASKIVNNTSSAISNFF